MELEFNDAGQLRLVIPEQKFAPNGKDTLTFPAPSTADALANEQRVPAGLTIDVQFEMTSPISQIVCESHPKAVKSEIISGDPRRGSLKMPTTPNPLVEDLEILVQLEDPSRLSAIVQKNEKGDKIAMVSFWPRLVDFEPLGEVIFLVDRSGSMQGTKMRRTIETMQIFLRSLSPGVKFNIISFGSTHTKLFPNSTEYDETSLAKATELVSKMSANMGGTEILAPLRSIFQQPADPKYPRQLFLLTDGEVSDPSSCIQACKSASDTTRVFCFGIGSGASKKLVEGMAKAGGGEFEMIGDSERIDDKVLKQLGQALVPAITNVVVEWPSADVKMKAPHRHTPVFQGSRVTSFVWLNSGAKTLNVKLSAVGPNGKINLEENVDASKTREGDFVFALAARRMLKDFEEARSYAHTTGGSLLPGWSEPKIKQEMIKISLETNVMCQHTAFVAVEERDGSATTGEMVLRKVIQASAEQPKPMPQANYMDRNSLFSYDALGGPGGGYYGAAGGAPPPQQQQGPPLSMRGGGGGGYPAPPGMAPGGGFGGPPSMMLGGAPASPRSAGGPPGGYPAPSGAPLARGPVSSSSSSFSGFTFAPPPAPGRSSSMAPPPPPPAASSVDMLLDMAPPASASYELQSAPLSQKLNAAPFDLFSGFAAEGAAPAKAKLSDSEVNKMKETILKQTAMGSWKLDDAAAALKVSAADISSAFSSSASAYASGDKKDTALSVFATALLCVLFETKYAAEKVTWQLVVKKARTWINKQALTAVDWDSVCKSFLERKKLI
eukprot:TRINITY_DN4497_c0_g2_i2.p1 TRINITY_DN4497_c0_g2~~TRINITY_DN4497_c0_g2_i2.p1  ORF type:complete len:779 (+),score=206.84 TRINITY_DN4497_c0_g2_i2:241-2577(+)